MKNINFKIGAIIVLGFLLVAVFITWYFGTQQPKQEINTDQIALANVQKS
ncbi:hypothetical protein KKG24_01680 [Patescibacteria group bacterium]|nr:hypothetical protein [Patescibacteria group bacterium]